MGFDIQRLAELLKLAEEYNRSQYGKGNPRDVEAKTLDQIFNERVSGQTDPFDPISKFLMDSPVSFCLDAISIMYVGRDITQDYEGREQYFKQIKDHQHSSELQQNAVPVTEPAEYFETIINHFGSVTKEEIINQMNKPDLSEYLKRGFRSLGIVVPFISHQ